MHKRASVMTPNVPSLPTNSWVRLGPVAARRLALGVHDPAVGQHDLETDHHVLDLPVARRVLAGTAAGQPAADGRQVHRLGPVTQRVPLTHPAQGGLEIGPERPGPHVGRERGFVDRRDPLECGEVQGDATVHGYGTATHAAAARSGRHRDDCLVAGGQDGGHLVRRARSYHGGWPLRDAPFGRPADGERPPVASGFGAAGRVGEHGGATGRESLEEGGRRVDRRRAESIGDFVVLRVDRGDGRRRGHDGSSPAVKSSFWYDSVNRAACSFASFFVHSEFGREE